MIEIRKIDVNSRKDVRAFIQFQFDLYKNDPNWVPPFRNDVAMMMNRRKHPFYEYGEADFFLALRDGRVVGRIAAHLNPHFNDYQKKKVMSFCLFDAIYDPDVATALFNAAMDWGRERGMTELIGPKGLSLFDGYGVLVEGFNLRQSMNMSAYNYPYYQTLLEGIGLSKVTDFISVGFEPPTVVVPDKVARALEIVKKHGEIKIFTFKNRKEILARAREIGSLYEKAFSKNWEYFPLTKRDLDFLIENVINFVDPTMVKFIVNGGDELIGFILGFPDISAAMQRHNGNLMNPLLIFDILREIKKTDRIIINGVGILSEYRIKGGDALLFDGIHQILKANPRFQIGEGSQMSETAKEVQREMQGLGLKKSKVHRVYQKGL